MANPVSCRGKVGYQDLKLNSAATTCGCRGVSACSRHLFWLVFRLQSSLAYHLQHHSGPEQGNSRLSGAAVNNLISGSSPPANQNHSPGKYAALLCCCVTAVSV